jgi:metallo-beta-lactamase class B
MRAFGFLAVANLVVGLLAAKSVDASSCDSLGRWNKPHAPFKIYGESYYVGTGGLSSILIASDRGHVLIDGALEESAPLIVANIRALGFRIEDVKLILNSHVHCDHAGGVA